MALADHGRTSDTLVVATDGSSLGNPGAGGWAWYVEHNLYCAVGNPGPVTNNQMELIAFEQALVTLESIPLILEVDSQYTINAVTKWHHGWRRNGWRNSKGDPVANRESIERILEVLARRNLAGVHTDIRWVRGHSGSQRNEEADRLARECAEKARILGKAIRLRAGNP